MHASKFQLSADRWSGWLEFPAEAHGLAGGPVLLVAVVPLKTGQGRLRLDFLQPLRGGGGRTREVELKVLQHGPKHLVGSFSESGEIRTAIASEPTFAWLESYSSTLLERRPIAPPTFQILGQPSAEPRCDEYLTATFGRTEAEILNGANPRSFGVELQEMPARRAHFLLDAEYAPLDSVLIARGCVPVQMEDKWFVFMSGGRLRFHRSWTGVLIYDVEAAWRGDRLYLGQVTANRDAGQYGETNDAHDLAMLRWIVDVVLRGVASPFPAQGEAGSLQAWASAGSASL